MPATWDSVVSNPKYQALPPDQREAAKKQYFDTVVAPKVPKDHLDAAQSQFNQYSEKLAAAQPRSFGESTRARAGEVLDEKPSGLASFIRTKALGFDPITPISKISGVISSPFAAAGETIERKAGQMAGVEPKRLEKIARDTGDVAGNLSNILPGPKIASAAEDVVTAGKELSSVRHGKFVEDLVLPAKTKAVKQAQVGRTVEKGINQKKTVSMTPREKEVAAEVKKLPVSRRKSFQANYNIIRDANIDEAKKLQAKLEKNDVFVDLGDVQKMTTAAVKEARENPSVAASKSVAVTVLNKFNKAILNVAIKNNNRLTASGLLQARKDFDASVHASHPKIFDAQIENSLTEMTHHLRTALNDLIESKVPDQAYKASLKKQNALYEAMKNIRPKAAKEPNSLIGRAVIHPVTKMIGPLVKPTAAGAIGGATAYHYLGGGQ